MRTMMTLFTLAAAAQANVTLHPLFSDNMVLQREANVNVWGTAAPNEAITVTLTAGGMSQVTPGKADDKGAWKIMLTTHAAATDGTLTVKGTNTVALKNVAVGDVWLCSGQSNMEWKLGGLGREEQGKKASEKAANKNIRFFTVPNRPFKTPQSTFPVSKTEGLWLECTPETALNFSAVGYFFGREIEKSQHVPVGLLDADWGGTPCEAWTSQAGLAAEPGLKHYLDAVAAIDEKKMMDNYEKAAAKYKDDQAKAKADGKPFTARAPTKPQNGGVNQNTPTALFNGMIAPITHFNIKGGIWYQGESNAGRAKEYRTLYPAMIKDWRKQWGYDFPFFTVQLAPFKGNQGSVGVDYAELRDAQTNTGKVLPKVGMAVITDSGEETDIHPQRKEPAGVRLALAARAIAYGEKIEYSGPVFKDAKFYVNQAIVNFDHAEGLKASGDDVHGFMLAGEDKVFHPAKAHIKGNVVVLATDKVANPVAVRFGWVNFAKPELNLFNGAGLPAVPFRSDDWPLTTK